MGWMILGSVALVAIILIQIGRINELAAKIRGEEEAQFRSSTLNAGLGMVFMIGFLIFVFATFMYYKNSMLGYGPHEAASEHGKWIDSIFNVTMIITVIVFVITHILLFWYTWKYRERPGHQATFYPHNNTLEMVWMGVPAIVMTFLVISGLSVWNKTMKDYGEDWTPVSGLSTIEDNQYIEVEGTGLQWQWILRHPGKDGKLGTKYYKEIKPGINPLGQIWEDEKNLDDIHPDTLVLPVNVPVRVRITAMDVLHNFYLPHFRVKMDAVPGLPTYFTFKPEVTTEQYRERLGALDSKGNPKYPEWHQPADPEAPKGPKRYETFNYELACAELCGKGHFSMRRFVKIVEQDEYIAWMARQKSYYMTNVKGTEEDVNKGVLSEKTIEVEVGQEDMTNTEKATEVKSSEAI